LNSLYYSSGPPQSCCCTYWFDALFAASGIPRKAPAFLKALPIAPMPTIIAFARFASYQEDIDTSSALGQALFTIVSAVAQLERDLIRERVTVGVRNARANGKQLGRPKSSVNCDRILELKAQGHSLRRIAKELAVGYGTVRERLLSTGQGLPVRPETFPVS
jgi:hypothetical protein